MDPDRTDPQPKQRRAWPWGLAALLALVVLLVACEGATAPPSTPTVTNGRWSDPATWGGALPQEGDDVLVPAGLSLLLDIEPPPLGGLTIDGTLVFDRRDLALTAEWIRVRGRLEVGSEAEPFRQHATITLTGPDEDVAGLGGRFLAVEGGILQLVGEPRDGWTRLAATAPAGAAEITLERDLGWRAGDLIVIASTDFAWEQAETRTITAVRGTTVELDTPLEWTHYGELQTFAGRTLDARAEVGLLSRNLVLQGADDALWAGGFGAHLMAHHSGELRIDGVEFRRVGQRGRLGRYPVHWHMVGDGAAGGLLRRSSIHGSANRCVTVHASNGVTVDGVVAYDAEGHCFFLEDGAETGVTLRNNLALSVREPEEPLLASDASYRGPAAYWITHPDNVIEGNVAAGGQGTGFWIALPEHPTGPSATDTVWNRRTPLARFADNVAHSQAVDGLHVDNGPVADLSAQEPTVYYARVDPADEDSAGVWVDFERFTAFKNRNRGIWLRGRMHRVIDPILADNAIGVTMASHDSHVYGALIIGESNNLGTPQPWEARGVGERSLPKPWECEGCWQVALHGFELYDGTVGMHDSTFVNFTPAEVHFPDGRSSLRQAAAISQFDFTAFPVSPENHVEAITLIDAVGVHFEARPTPTDRNASEDGYRSTVFRDLDGSLSGLPGAAITVPNPFLDDGSCSLRSDWNAYVCRGEYAQLSVRNAGPGGFFGPVTLRRNGAEHTLLGTPGDDPYFTTALLLEQSYDLSLGGSAPQHLRLILRYGSPGDSVSLVLPYSDAELWLYDDWWIDARNRMQQVGSPAELAASSGEAYYLGGGELHLKLVVANDRDMAVIDICRSAECR